MEEKRYPVFEEEENVGMASEPIAAPVADYMPVDTIVADDEIENLDWDKFPCMGPFSDEEAIARIAEAEKDLGDPSKWISSEEVTRRLYEKFPWLR